MDLTTYQNCPIRGGFTIARLELRDAPLTDAIGREAIAKTAIVGRRFEILLRTPLSEEELSISLYHEILEAMTVAVPVPPVSVLSFNEADFEAAARRAHEKFGPASPENFGRMLQSFGFGED